MDLLLEKLGEEGTCKTSRDFTSFFMDEEISQYLTKCMVKVADACRRYDIDFVDGPCPIPGTSPRFKTLVDLAKASGASGKWSFGLGQSCVISSAGNVE